MGELLFPSVRWAQDENFVFLKVELRNVQEPQVKFANRKVEFQSVGEGAKGCNQYYFVIDLYGQLIEEECLLKINETFVNIVLKKSVLAEPIWWPRLTLKPEKFAWLKIDFNKWKDPEVSSSDDEDANRRQKMINNDFDMEAYEKQQAEEMWKQLGLEAKNFDSSFDLKKIYLVTYNAFMFAGFLYILYNLVHGYVQEQTEYFPKTWHDVSGKIFCCQIAQFLEIGHILVGYVKSSLPTTVMQLTGRSIVICGILNAEERMQDKPFVFYLFFLYSFIEIIRYSYYLLTVLNKNIGVLTWLRYTAWVILYPLGFLCEGIIILRAIPYFEETQQFSYQLPNVVNVSFDFPSVIKLYLTFVFLPAIPLLMSHMRQLRLKKLQKKKVA